MALRDKGLSRIAGRTKIAPLRKIPWESALRFMRVHEMAGKSGKLLDLDLPVSGLYLLAAPKIQARPSVSDTRAPHAAT